MSRTKLLLLGGLGLAALLLVYFGFMKKSGAASGAGGYAGTDDATGYDPLAASFQAQVQQANAKTGQINELVAANAAKQVAISALLDPKIASFCDAVKAGKHPTTGTSLSNSQKAVFKQICLQKGYAV